MIVVDSSFLYALLDAGDRRHREAVDWYRHATDELATTPLVLAEVDHLATRAGSAARGAFRRDVEAGAYLVDWWPGAATESVAVAERYGDTGVSLTDASLVVLAARHETTRVATFDFRVFRALRPLSGEPAFALVPADA